MVIAVLAVLSLAGGGLLAHVSAGGSGGSNVVAAGGVGRIGDGSVLVAAQPAPSTLSGAGCAERIGHRDAVGNIPVDDGIAKPKPTATSSKPKPKPSPTKTTPPSSGSVVDQLLAQINDLRAQHGLPAYTPAQRLEPQRPQAQPRDGGLVRHVPSVSGRGVPR